MNTAEILGRLVGFDTVSTKSNLDLVDFVETLLKASGSRVTRLPSPCGTKAGLYAEIGPETQGGLLLSAHSDVVPVDGQNWTKPPFSLTCETGKYYGRGTTDMKGFVASALALATGVKGRKLPRPFAILLSYDEEIGCVGLQEIKPALVPLLRAPDLCVVGEPTQMQVATGHKGKIAMRATFKGEAGHSALAPNYENALHLAADFMAKLRSLQVEIAKTGPFDSGYDIPYSTIHVGKLLGGTALNIVPERAEMTFELRNLPQQDQSHLLGRIRAFADDVRNAAGDQCIELDVFNSYPGLNVDRENPWAKAIIKLAGTGATKVAFGTEAGILSDLGVPTIVCGPGSMAGQGHKADEYIDADQLGACDAFLDDLVTQYCA